jgi:hypothetical protein
MIQVRWLRADTKQKIPLNTPIPELDKLDKTLPGQTTGFGCAIFSFKLDQKACIQVHQFLLSPKCLLGLKYYTNYS